MDGGAAAGVTTHYSSFTLLPADTEESWTQLDAGGLSFTAGPVGLQARDAIPMLWMRVGAHRIELLLGGSELTETELTFTGLRANAGLHIYEDGYRDVRDLTTDPSGALSFDQPLGSARRALVVQVQSSTLRLDRSLPQGGDCPSVGVWNTSAATCTLTQDVDQTVDVGAGVTLDCAGHAIDVSASGSDAVALSGAGARLLRCEVVHSFRGVTVAPAASGTVIEDGLFRWVGTTSFSNRRLDIRRDAKTSSTPRVGVPAE